jgi:hypothetical protein
MFRRLMSKRYFPFLLFTSLFSKIKFLDLYKKKHSEIQKTLLHRRSRSQLFPSEDSDEQCSLAGRHWGTLFRCQFRVPYRQGRVRGCRFHIEVPPLIAQ